MTPPVLPAISITPALDADIASLLQPGESLSDFVLAAVLESLEHRRILTHARVQAEIPKSVVDPARLRILVVDDDEFSQKLLREMLQGLGVVEIHAARDGGSAMEALASLPELPDFLVCDMVMPNTDGISLLGQLASRKYRGGVILLSGADRLMLSIAAEVAASDGLRVVGSYTKPLRREDLGAALGLNS